MGIERQIVININSGGSPRITFSPSTLKANVADQIFWTNNDTVAHRPGLLDETTGKIDDKFFMQDPVAPNGNTSTVFSPGQVGPLKYKCSLHPDQNETGTIDVVS